MMNDFEVKKEGSVLTVVLGEELTIENSPALMEIMTGYRGQGIEKVVFDATRLARLSSSGVRIIIYCKQKLSENSEIVFVNCQKGVLDVLDIVGLQPFITFVER